MKAKILKAITAAMFLVSVVFVLPAQAQAKKSFLPGNIDRIFDLLGEDGSGTAGFVTSRVGTALFFTLGVLVLFGVVYAIIAAFKYIQSQGDPGQIEEAQKAIKAIFYGIAAMFLGIVGIALVFVFFVADQPDPSLFQTCLNAPNSVGCESCKFEGNETDNRCESCEAWYDNVANDAKTSINDIRDKNCLDQLDGGNLVSCVVDGNLDGCEAAAPPK